MSQVTAAPSARGGAGHGGRGRWLLVVAGSWSRAVLCWGQLFAGGYCWLFMGQLFVGAEHVTQDDFEMLKVLGRGSFGKVRRSATHRSTHSSRTQAQAQGGAPARAGHASEEEVRRQGVCNEDIEEEGHCRAQPSAPLLALPPFFFVLFCSICISVLFFYSLLFSLLFHSFLFCSSSSDGDGGW